MTSVPSSTVNPSVNANGAEAVLPDITAPETSEAHVKGEEPPPYQPPAGDTIPAASPIVPGILIPPTPASVPLTSESNAKPKLIALPSSAHRFVFGTSFAQHLHTLHSRTGNPNLALLGRNLVPTVLGDPTLGRVCGSLSLCGHLGKFVGLCSVVIWEGKG
jgi:hypothetical protein